MSEDPIGFEGRDGNLYAYVGNGPVNGVDPSGLANLWNPFTWCISDPHSWGDFLNPLSQQNRMVASEGLGAYWDSAWNGRQLSSLTGYADALTDSLNPFGEGTQFGSQYGADADYRRGRDVGGIAGFAINGVLTVSGIRGVITGIQAIRAAGGLLQVAQVALANGMTVNVVVVNGQALVLTPVIASQLGVSAAAYENLIQMSRAAGRGCEGAPQVPSPAELGYTQRIPPQKAPFNSHGQAVYSNGKTYITRDIDSHKGGVWKMFNRKGQRLGTYNADLTIRIGD